MLTYPALSQNPELSIVTESIWDTTVIRFKGKVEQRKANRAQEKLRFRFRYEAISAEDEKLLRDFFLSVRGSYKKFNWTNPETGLTYIVKFENEELIPPYIRYGLWNIGEIRLIQVI